MKFYTEDVVNKVRESRKKGLSIKTLEKKFNIPNTTISRWIRDIASENRAFINARLKEEQFKKQYNSLLENYEINSDNAKILLSLFYWCEGGKYPATNCLAFSNSDYQLVKTFLELLRLAFSIKEKRLRVHLQIHSTHKYQKIIGFWCKLLNVSKEQFYKPTITNPTYKMKRRDYYGTCTIKYHDVKMLLQIMGIYETFSNKFTRRGG